MEFSSLRSCLFCVKLLLVSEDELRHLPRSFSLQEQLRFSVTRGLGRGAWFVSVAGKNEEGHSLLPVQLTLRLVLCVGFSASRVSFTIWYLPRNSPLSFRWRVPRLCLGEAVNRGGMAAVRASLCHTLERALSPPKEEPCPRCGGRRAQAAVCLSPRCFGGVPRSC